MWAILFYIALAQGIFFLILLTFGKRLSNGPARYLIALLGLLMLTNFDYLLIAGDFYRSVPGAFGISNGLIMLMGPIVYLYARTLIGKPGSRYSFLHFIPYGIFLGLSVPMFTLPGSVKIEFIESFIEGRLPLRRYDYVAFLVQIIHLCIYGYLVSKILKHTPSEVGTDRQRWIRWLNTFASGYGILVAALVIVVFESGSFSLYANYGYALACSFFTYFITGYALLNPASAFAIGKRSRKPLDGFDISAYEQKLLDLIETRKIYLQPEVRLQDVAEQIHLSPHQLSQLINERFGKNFADFMNYYRVEEFKNRLQYTDHDHLTLVGLALESGFSSKTSFNHAFKKVTGVTPSAYKRSLEDK